jgi:hypothetical protein
MQRTRDSETDLENAKEIDTGLAVSYEIHHAH